MNQFPNIELWQESSITVFFLISSFNVKCCLSLQLVCKIATNVLRLGEGGDLTTNVHTKHTLQIYEKLSYEALNRHFCQTAVSGWASLFSVCQQHFLSC